MVTKKALVPLLLIFTAVFLVALGFILARPVDSYEVMTTEKNTVERIEIMQSALSIEGMGLLGDSWRHYPEYTIGLGAIVGISLLGMGWCVWMIEKPEAQT